MNKDVEEIVKLSRDSLIKIAIEKSDNVGSGGNVIDFENSMTFFEYKKYYDITVLCATLESFYKIDKGTGKVYDKGHSHLIINEENDAESEKFIEIK